MLRLRISSVSTCLNNPSRLKRKRAKNAWMFLAPSLAGVFLFFLLPLVDVVRRSLLKASGGAFAGIENYREVIENQAFRLAAYNTCHFLAVCIPLLLLLSFAVALMVYRCDLKSGLLKTTIVLPMAIPVASIVLLWKVVFDKQGVLNQFLAQLSLTFGAPGGAFPEVDWINGKTAFGVLVATYLWKNTGYDMLLWLAGLSAIPESLYEAARVDGAGEWQKLIYITLPELKGTMAMIFLLSVLNSFKVFRETYLIAGSYPDDSIYMLQHLFNHWFLNLDIQKMSAAAVMMTGMIVLPVIVWKLRRREGEDGG